MKKCPFCKAHENYLTIESILDLSMVHCTVCGCYGPEGEDENEAVERWDIRQEVEDA